MTRGAKFRFVNGVGLYTLPALERQAGFDHGFTARSGGVSEGYFASLNLSFTRPENRENVMENYRIFCRAAQIPFDSMVMDNYEHGTTVIRVDRADAGRGYLIDPLPACDGLVTNDPAITLITGHADCMAFYFVDPVRRCIGLAHAGWRGALGRIGGVVVGSYAGITAPIRRISSSESGLPSARIALKLAKTLPRSLRLRFPNAAASLSERGDGRTSIFG